MAKPAAGEIVEMNELNVHCTGVKDSYIIAKTAAEINTETDKLKPSHNEGAQEQPGTAPDDTPKITTRCLRSLCDKLCTTAPSKDFTITKLDFIFHAFSIFTLIADIGTDIWVAVLHYKNDDIWWFALTLAFVFAPCLILGVTFFFSEDKNCENFLLSLLTITPGLIILG